MHAQKFESHPTEDKASREFLCMKMIRLALFFQKENLDCWGWKNKREGRQESMLGIWVEVMAVGMERTYVV